MRTFDSFFGETDGMDHHADAGAHCVTDAFATSHRPVLQTTSLPSFLTYNNVGVLPLLTFKVKRANMSKICR